MRNLIGFIFLFVLIESVCAIPDSGFRIKKHASLITHSPSLIPHSPSLIPHSPSLIPHSLSLIPHPSFLIPHSPSLIPVQKRYYDTTVSERGWVARAAYNQQETKSWVEFGFGRMARLQHYNAFAKGTTAAAASFTFGADFGYDTSLIAGPKLSMEFSSVFLGGRVSYGYYMQDGNSSGVIGLEGGLNFVSVFFIYAGYNFVKGNSETPVITEGARFSIGFNYPIGMRRVPPPNRPTHL